MGGIWSLPLPYLIHYEKAKVYILKVDGWWLMGVGGSCCWHFDLMQIGTMFEWTVIYFWQEVL